ncbi:hypothetical protein [uncultured Chitinophaga sp.]|jgi:hypothetical protein|uniref:hypothetical protein n=1 Tax=uncultured Chitinophaga sp. TaxID=339340 RepID=UPI0026177DE0|nr:hypothetical protein [uncultured Chitinophaga sp.]
MKSKQQLAKKLITKHVELADLTSNLQMTGVTIYLMDSLNLFDMALDLLDYPAEGREELREEAASLRMQDIDAFIARLYVEADSSHLLLDPVQ